MFGIGMTELFLIATIGLLVLGPKRLPELARSLGRTLAEFRQASTELRQEFLDVQDELRDAAHPREGSGKGGNEAARPDQPAPPAAPAAPDEPPEASEPGRG